MRASRHLGLLSAITGVAVLLALPLPSASQTPPPPGPTGPPSLTDAAPEARLVEIAGSRPDGTSFAPSAMGDQTTVVGRISNPDYSRLSLVVLPVGGGSPRVLESTPPGLRLSIDAVTVADGRVYWASRTTDGDSPDRVRISSADLRSGPVRVLTSDVGQADFRGSSFDLQVADGHLHWTATRGLDPVITELRSVPVAGGPVRVRPLDGAYAPRAWPWLSSAPVLSDDPVVLFNAVTDERHPVRGRAALRATCSTAWCRITADGITLVRPDGTSPVLISEGGEYAVTGDVALLGRYELLAAPLADSVAPIERLYLYDLKWKRRMALGVTDTMGTDGRWFWWATGDNEALTWQLLDLKSLP